MNAVSRSMDTAGVKKCAYSDALDCVKFTDSFLQPIANLPTALLATGAKAEAEMRHKVRTRRVRNMVEI